VVAAVDEVAKAVYALIRKAQQSGAVELDTGNVNDFCLDNLLQFSDERVRAAVTQLITSKMVDIKPMEQQP
jgi:hypothetical protein